MFGALITDGALELALDLAGAGTRFWPDEESARAQQRGAQFPIRGIRVGSGYLGVGGRGDLLGFCGAVTIIPALGSLVRGACSTREFHCGWEGR